MSDRLRILITRVRPVSRRAPSIRRNRWWRGCCGCTAPAFGDVEFIGHIFPVTYRAVDRELPDLLAKHRPDALLMFGLASRTGRYVRIETRARNAVTTLWPRCRSYAGAQGIDRT